MSRSWKPSESTPASICRPVLKRGKVSAFRLYLQGLARHDMTSDFLNIKSSFAPDSRLPEVDVKQGLAMDPMEAS